MRLDDEEFVRGQYRSPGQARDAHLRLAARRRRSHAPGRRPRAPRSGRAGTPARGRLRDGRLRRPLPRSSSRATSWRSTPRRRWCAPRQARGVHAVIGDVQELPFPDADFDCAVAAWMLYHVPDLDRGIAELARVLAARRPARGDHQRPRVAARAVRARRRRAARLHLHRRERGRGARTPVRPGGAARRRRHRRLPRPRGRRGLPRRRSTGPSWPPGCPRRWAGSSRAGPRPCSSAETPGCTRALIADPDGRLPCADDRRPHPPRADQRPAHRRSGRPCRSGSPARGGRGRARRSRPGTGRRRRHRRPHPGRRAGRVRARPRAARAAADARSTSCPGTTTTASALEAALLPGRERPGPASFVQYDGHASAGARCVVCDTIVPGQDGGRLCARADGLARRGARGRPRDADGRRDAPPAARHRASPRWTRSASSRISLRRARRRPRRCAERAARRSPGTCTDRCTRPCGGRPAFSCPSTDVAIGLDLRGSAELRGAGRAARPTRSTWSRTGRCDPRPAVALTGWGRRPEGRRPRHDRIRRRRGSGSIGHLGLGPRTAARGQEQRGERHRRPRPPPRPTAPARCRR